MSIPRVRDRRSARRQPARLLVVRLPAPFAGSGRAEVNQAAEPGEAAAPVAAVSTVVAVDSADTVGSVGAAQADLEVDGAVAAAEGGVATVSAKPRRWRPLVTVLALALVGALVAAGMAGQRWYEQHRLEAAHQAALAAAKQATVDFVSISAASVESDLQRISEGATGTFAEEFTRGMPQVREAVVANDVESRGTVLRAGLVSGDLDSAVVLVAVDATVKNVRAPEGRLSHYRIQVELTRDPDSGRWLVSRLQFVG